MQLALLSRYLSIHHFLPCHFSVLSKTSSALSFSDSGDVRKAHSMENLLQQTSDQSKASSIPPSPTAPQKLHRSWSAKKRSGSNTDVDGGGKDRTKRYSKQMTDSQGKKVTSLSMYCCSRVSKHKTSCLADTCIIKLLWPNCMQILSVKRKILLRKGIIPVISI